MLTPFVALLAVLPPSSQGEWVATALTPIALADKTDARLANLRNANLTYHFSFYKEALGYAFADCEAKIVSPTVFWLQIPNVDARRKNTIEFETWISDGKRFGKSLNPEKPRPAPLSSRPGVPPKPASIWFSDFSRVILSGLGQTTHPFASLVKDAKVQGYKTTSEVRRMTVGGKAYISYRLVLTKGKARYETVIDGRQFLPVSVTNTIGDVDNSRWSGKLWSFPNKPIDASVARFRPVAKG